MRRMSDDPPWLNNLPHGLPPNFDYSAIRTTDDAVIMMTVLPNRDRGTAGIAGSIIVSGSIVACAFVRMLWSKTALSKTST
jgi:hypothetical protein